MGNVSFYFPVFHFLTTPSADTSATPPPTEDNYKVVNGRSLTQRLELFSHNKESNGRRRFEQSKRRRKEIGIKTRGFREEIK